MENNLIEENGAGGCSGINLDGVTDTVLRNNLLIENHAGGISIFQENGAVCSTGIQVLHNTIVQGEDGRWAVNLSGRDCTENKIFNNIILTHHAWRGSILVPAERVPGFESDYSIVMDRFSADDDQSVISLAEWQALGYDRNSFLAAPEELFAGVGDYRLRPGSPAVDAGRLLADVFFDLSGISRPQGASPDIGAFEQPETP